jgi:hypothetical protein
MKSWCRVKLEWAVDMLHQMFRPLFLSYRIAGESASRVAKMAMDGR